MARKLDPAGNGMGPVKRVKSSISAAPKKPKVEAATDWKTFKDAFEVEIPSMHRVEARKEYLKDCIKRSKKQFSMENDGDFYLRCSQTHDVIQLSEALERKRIMLTVRFLV